VQSPWCVPTRALATASSRTFRFDVTSVNVKYVNVKYYDTADSALHWGIRFVAS